MKPNRQLALRRETLTDLTADELTFGGAAGEAVGRDELLLLLTLHRYCSWSCH